MEAAKGGIWGGAYAAATQRVEGAAAVVANGLTDALHSIGAHILPGHPGEVSGDAGFIEKATKNIPSTIATVPGYLFHTIVQSVSGSGEGQVATPLSFFLPASQQAAVPAAQQPAPLVLSQELIRDLNARVKTSEEQGAIERHFDGMLKLAGIVAGELEQKLNIPAARQELEKLMQLVGIPDIFNPTGSSASAAQPKSYLLRGLEHLAQVFEQDPCTPATSVGLDVFADTLMESLGDHIVQPTAPHLQAAALRVFYLLLECIREHSEKGHFSLLTKKTKKTFETTATGLLALNVKNKNATYNWAFSFYGKSALQVINYLTMHRESLLASLQELSKVTGDLRDLYHAAKGQTNGGAEEAVEVFGQKFQQTMQDLHGLVRGSHGATTQWYMAAAHLRSLAHEIKFMPQGMAPEQAEASLVVLLKLIESYKHRGIDWKPSHNWKFSYAAILILTDLSLHAAKPELRKLAILGLDEPVKVKGLVGLFDPSLPEARLNDYPSATPRLKQRELPEMKDPNIGIRQLMCECLTRISQESKEDVIKEAAGSHLSKIK